MTEAGMSAPFQGIVSVISDLSGKNVAMRRFRIFFMIWKRTVDRRRNLIDPSANAQDIVR